MVEQNKVNVKLSYSQLNKVTRVICVFCSYPGPPPLHTPFSTIKTHKNEVTMRFLKLLHILFLIKNSQK